MKRKDKDSLKQNKSSRVVDMDDFMHINFIYIYIRMQKYRNIYANMFTRYILISFF